MDMYTAVSLSVELISGAEYLTVNRMNKNPGKPAVCKCEKQILQRTQMEFRIII